MVNVATATLPCPDYADHPDRGRAVRARGGGSGVGAVDEGCGGAPWRVAPCAEEIHGAALIG